MMDILERQDQTLPSRSNIYVCDNNGCDLYLIGVSALVCLIPCITSRCSTDFVDLLTELCKLTLKMYLLGNFTFPVADVADLC